MTGDEATDTHAPVRLGVDVGGTFTDVTLTTPTGDLVTAKVPTTADQSEGVLAGIEAATERAGLEPDAVEEFTHATTVSINALLERSGAKTALVTTAGFRDVLEIGRQTRPSLYDVTATRPEPLVPRRRRLEIDERASEDGVERPVTDEACARLADEVEALGAESVAVSLLHAYATPENEARLADALRERLSVPVSASHEVLPEFREFERTSTTAVDAFVRPTIDAYLGRLIDRLVPLEVPPPHVMGSNGGIAAAETVRERAATTLLSGPAAGVVGASRTASAVADERDLDGLVTFDMGGTSSDVSLVTDGDVARTTDAVVDGLPLGLPMVDLETVGSGGGSVAWVDEGGALRVGPRSAGADPGPACYGRGGDEPTVTDATLALGYLGSDTALGGTLSLEPDRARAVLSALAAEAALESALEAAAGVYRVANATMERAIRAVTVERGHDPRRFGLVAFGGAGPVHAAALADRLEMETVVVPLPAGVLSAFGLLVADERADAARTHRVSLADADLETLETLFTDLESDALADVRAPDQATLERRVDCRYRGQSFELAVPVGDPIDRAAVEARFHEAHERAYGYRREERIDLVTLRASAVVERDAVSLRYDGGDDLESARRTTRPIHVDGTERDAPVYERPRLPVDARVDGPAVIEGREATTLVPPDWQMTVHTDGTLVLRRDRR
ncbi:hydantoinase/oxoprolinase family protein [Natronobiforma cellulositropha]|uniref:hydantoinase/oxoprolinase family protein n=1 Tax=Natronobiforma cellulositropha TaxID=1679076 RepID=UPI0021D5B47F|nr:hydantoinase/oxoprolinase family protein [Natronobiforma cellulositropha]